MSALAASIDAVWEADLLTGTARSPGVEDLKKRALAIRSAGTRLMPFWTAGDVECHAVGPSTRCFCGHSWSSHAWYETGKTASTRQVRCRVDGCKCTCFQYHPGRGSSHLRCGCKHTHEDHSHNGRPGKCKKPGCECTGFHSDWRCGCGATFDEHTTTLETRAERLAAGKPAEENLGGWGAEKPHLDAVCGAVTRMDSLLHGVERLAIAGGGGGGAGPSALAAPAASSTAAVLQSYDRRAEAHVARLRRIRDGGAERAGGRASGHAPAPAAPGAEARPRPSNRAVAAARAAQTPSLPTRRELAAAAAERRLKEEITPEADVVPAAPPPRRPGAGAPAPGRGRQGGAARAAARGNTMTPRAGAAPPRAGVPPRTGAPVAGARPPKGRGGAAVRAARRERHAEAAEQRAAAVVGSE